MANQHSARPRTPTRDSHDLSLSPRDVTRDSFVTNMLLSLDQYSLGQSASPDRSNNRDNRAYNDLADDNSPQLFDSAPWQSQSHHRPNDHAYSSDIESADNSSSKLSSPPTSRGNHQTTTATTPPHRNGNPSGAPPVTPTNRTTNKTLQLLLLPPGPEVLRKTSPAIIVTGKRPAVVALRPRATEVPILGTAGTKFPEIDPRASTTPVLQRHSHPTNHTCLQKQTMTSAQRRIPPFPEGLAL